MNETKKLIERNGVKLFLKKIAGSCAPTIVSNLVKPISDEDLAEMCGMRSADVRMILNKLHYVGLIDYNRSKDNESGWYYYSWFVRPDKLLETYINSKKQDLEDLEEMLENNEIYTMYICRKCDQTYDFDKAAELLYHCPLCESILDRGTTDEDIRKMKMIARSIKKEISEVISAYGKLSEIKHKSMKVL